MLYIYIIASEPFLSVFTVQKSAYADDVTILVNDQHDIINRLAGKVLIKFPLQTLTGQRVQRLRNRYYLVGCQGRREVFKYPGVFLGDEATVRKNWEGECFRKSSRKIGEVEVAFNKNVFQTENPCN